MNSYALPEPFWMLIQREKPLRDLAVAERVEALLEQKELINCELEMLRGDQRRLEPKEIALNWKASLAGFHNPRKHTGLTGKELLMEYQKRKKKNVAVAAWLQTHEDEALRFIRQSFYRTIRG